MTGNYHYIIGVDSGTNTAVCCWYRPTKQIIYLETLLIHRALDLVLQWHRAYPGRLYMRIEDARKANFGRSLDGAKAQGAGSIKRDGAIWNSFCEDYGIPYEMVRPNKKTTKWDAKKFKAATGYQQSTNNHERDAALMVYNF